jgi:predicted nucleic acid-binding protein
MATKPLRIAADTNLLLDLADEVEPVLDALRVIKDRLPEAEKLVTPSVLEELAYLCDSGESGQIRSSAQRAIAQLRREHSFRPLLELPFSSTAIEDIANEIRHEGLLPPEEVHDSRILAEAILLNCGILLTSDAHLRSIDYETMTMALKHLDLVPPIIATPREIVRKFFH